MSKKIIIPLLLIFLLVMSLPVGVYLVRQRQELRLIAAPSTTLSISPATLTLNVNDQASVNVAIDTGENQVVGADLYLSFNSSVIEVLSISPGTFLENPQILAENIDNTSGSIVYSIGSFTAKKGSGVLASLSIQAKAEGTSPLTFGSSTTVAGIGETEALKNTVPGSITVGTVQASPSPSPSPSPGVSPSPSPSPGVSPSPSPSPGAGGLPSPSPSPSPLAMASPSPSPTTTAVSLTSITSGSTVYTTRPTFSGTAAPGATITITIDSPTIQGTTYADSSGYWSWIPSEDIPTGQHTVTITAVDNQGNTSTTSSTFTVSTEELPEAGILSPTLFFLSAGGVFLLLTFLLI